MPRVLIDVTNQRLGGGLQVAHAVISAVTSEEYRSQVTILALRGSSLSQDAKGAGLQVWETSGSALARVARRVVPVRAATRRNADVVYTVFGTPPWFRPRCPWIVGVAYSNLFYPEIDFWAAESRPRRQIRRLKDLFRLRSLLRADAWIFETEALRLRAVRQFDLDPACTAVIPPPVNPWIYEHLHTGRSIRGSEHQDAPVVLLAAGWHPNKNLLMALGVAESLARGGTPCHFIFTLDPVTEGGQRVLQEARERGIQDWITCVGRVPPHGMGQLVSSVDVILLISHLESFSNNVLEAFGCRVPLVISDRDWARAACRDAAVYVDPNSEVSIGEGIRDALSNTRIYVERGAQLLEQEYLSAEDRMHRVWDFLGSVHRALSKDMT